MKRRAVVLPLVFVLVASACGRTSSQPVAGAPVASAPHGATTSDAAPTSPEVVLAHAPPSWPHVRPAVVASPRGMVVTDEATASRVGRDILARGGNAVDAAVATAFALAVTYPTAGNIGGGGFALARVGSAFHALDFREMAPAAVKHDTFVDAEGKPRSDIRTGIRSAGVPGSVAGLWELHRALGSKKLPWSELVAPALALAAKGFVVDGPFVDMIEAARARLEAHPASAALFLPGGKPPEKGSVFVNPALARVLSRIAERGADGFYRGATADAIAAQMTAEGGFVTSSDLASYQAKWRTPLSFTYRGHRVASMPPPSSGGVTLAMMAHVLEGYDLRSLGWQSPEALHVTFEAMRRAYAARNAKLGDPDFVNVPTDELLSASWAERARRSIASDRATPSSELPTDGAPSGLGPHTTHFSVVDAAGNAVSLTTTINYWFGSGVTVADGGFVLNNEMDDFAAVPGTPNGFGLVQGEANAVAPHKRMLSSMAPTIVAAPDGTIELVLGAAGGPTIITSVFQELSNVVDFGLDVGQSVAAPRFHMQHLPDVVTFEKDGLAEATKERLTAMGYAFKERDHIADAPAIGRVGGAWWGVAEPRRPGGLAAAP